MAKMLIGGLERASSDGAWIDVLNPATLEIVDSIPNGTQDDATAAVACAAKSECSRSIRLSAVPLPREASTGGCCNWTT